MAHTYAISVFPALSLALSRRRVQAVHGPMVGGQTLTALVHVLGVRTASVSSINIMALSAVEGMT
eukprot:1260566-Amphidinium_carterae.1